MFGNAYQNGPTLEVWDAKVNIDKNQFYKQLFKIIPNSNLKYFDKEVKSYLYNIQTQNMKMILPADESKSLALHQQFLVLHIFIPIGFTWAIQFTMTDVNGIKRRVNITTTQGKQQIKYFSFRYPIDNLKKGVWLFLGIDFHSFMAVFKDQTFRSLDQICISSSCRVRRIFTMKQFVQFEIPKNYWLSQGIPQDFQLIELKGGFKEISELPKQLTESIVTPKKLQNSSISIKKDFSPKQKNKSQINGSHKVIQGRKDNLIKSELIIENARNRIESLTKEEEKLLRKSRQLEANPHIKFPKEKNIFKLEQQKEKSVAQKNRPTVGGMKEKDLLKKVKPSFPEKVEVKANNSKLPQIQISFREDSALNFEQDQSSNFTEQHMKAFTPKTPKDYEKKEVIEEDRWSEEEREQSRPITQLIGNITGNFPSTVITRQNNKEIVVNKANKKQLELIYDEMVGCYYHPQTNSYYELRQ